MPIFVSYNDNNDNKKYDIQKYNSLETIKKYKFVIHIICSSYRGETHLTSLPNNMNFPNLEHFDCSSNNLTSFPNNMHFPNLEHFDCAMNFLLKTLPNNMNFPNLKYFDCSDSKIISLPDNMNFPNLEHFDSSRTELISLPNNMNFPNLTYFNCSFTKLRSLPDNMNLPNLQYFHCSNTELISLPDNMNLPNLIFLNCDDTKLSSLSDNMNLPNLSIFQCCNSQLSSLPNNMNFPKLHTFYLANNKLTSLPENMILPNLKNLDCSRNQLTSLPVCILNFQNLKMCHIEANEIELSLQMARFINRIKNSSIKEINVYNDSQNIHNSNIQLSVKDSIHRITTRKDVKKYNIDELNTLIIENTILTDTSKSLLLEYINNMDVHSLLLLTFSEVLWFTIQTIITDFEITEQEEIFKILNQEIMDTECKCFTGRMNRVINCLNGFSPLVNINIKDGEQIGNIIVLIKNKLVLSNSYTIEKHKIEVEKELFERNYDIETIKIWLEYIY